MKNKICYEPRWYRAFVVAQRREAEVETKNIRDALQKHYDFLFQKMLRNEGNLREGLMILSRRPRVYYQTKADAEKVLSEVENFLRENLPRVRIPPRPKILQ